jgi:hypothetical protein
MYHSYSNNRTHRLNEVRTSLHHEVERAVPVKMIRRALLLTMFDNDDGDEYYYYYYHFWNRFVL